MAAIRARGTLFMPSRNLCLFSRFAQTLANNVAHKNPKGLKETQSGTEFARKAYIVLPEFQTRGLEKNLWLTKSVLRNGLPKTMKNAEKYIPESEHRKLKSIFEDCIRQKFGFQKEETKRRSSIADEVRNGVLLEFLRCCFSHLYSAKVEASHLRESLLDVNTQVITHWKRKGNHYQLKTRPDCLLWTRQPIQLFAENDSEKTNDYEFLKSYKPDDLDVYSHSFVPLKNVPGCKKRQHSFLPYCHTMFLSGFNQSPSEMQSTGILNMFGLLHSHALDGNGNLLGKDLEVPLTTNCIVTDGNRFIFMCYQLNTLNFEGNDSGIKNMAWTTDCMELFTKKTHNSKKKKALIYESVSIARDLPKFNEECFRNFVTFISRI